MKVKILSMVILSILLLSGCGLSDEGEPARAQIFAMDTVMEITVYGEKGEEAVQAAEKKIRQWENLFSVNKSNSDIARINAYSGTYQSVSGDTLEIIKRSCEISERTEGLFDISIYPIVRAWGFTTGQYQVPTVKNRKQLCQKVDYKKIHCQGSQVFIPKGMELDLGGIAKGYASHHIIEMFRQMGVDSAIVSLGGNVETLGKKMDGNLYKIGIKDPFSPEELLGTVAIEDKAVITSGGYERYFEADGAVYHHIMDKRTGAPAKSDLASVTIVADDGVLADGLSTALFVVGSERAQAMQKEREDFEMILVKQDGEVIISHDLNFVKKK